MSRLCCYPTNTITRDCNNLVISTVFSIISLGSSYNEHGALDDIGARSSPKLCQHRLDERAEKSIQVNMFLRQTGRQADRQKWGRQTKQGGLTYGWTDRQTDRRLGLARQVQTDRIDRQTDRQIDRLRDGWTYE